MKEIQKGAELTGGDAYSQREKALAYAATGRKSEARKLLDHIPDKAAAPVRVVRAGDDADLLRD